MRRPLRRSNWLKRTSRGEVAPYSFTGIDTRPNESVPVQIACGTPLSVAAGAGRVQPVGGSGGGGAKRRRPRVQPLAVRDETSPAAAQYVVVASDAVK